MNKNITRLKEKKLKIFTWSEINKLIEWIFCNKKKPSYISVQSKPTSINFYFIFEPEILKPTGILLEYFSLNELKDFLRNIFFFKHENENVFIPQNSLKYKEILRFTKNNYKTIYAETGPQINLEKEIHPFLLKKFWVAKDHTPLELKPSIVILDCEMIEIIDTGFLADNNSTDYRIKTINTERIAEEKGFRKTINTERIAEEKGFRKKVKISSKLQVTNKYYKRQEYKKHVARVTMIDMKGNILLDEYILPEFPIINFHTKESGITKESLKNAITLSKLYKKIKKIIFSDTILVGHAIANDLLCLSINHSLIIDTSRLFSKRGYKNSLKSLAKKYFDKEIHNGPHSSVEDCLITRDLLVYKYNEYLELLFTYKRYIDIPFNQNETLLIKGINMINIKSYEDIKIQDLSLNILFFTKDDKIFYKLF